MSDTFAAYAQVGIFATPNNAPVVNESLPHLVRVKCCGIAEIHMLSRAGTPLAALQLLEAELRHGITWPPGKTRQNIYFPFLFFTGVVKDPDNSFHRNYGQEFADFITANDLGNVVTHPGKVNWTRNVIQMWLWEPKYDNVFALLDKERVAPVAVTTEQYPTIQFVGTPVNNFTVSEPEEDDDADEPDFDSDDDDSDSDDRW